jgi:DNA-binding transcriptional regulator YhcF (GntR family)
MIKEFTLGPRAVRIYRALRGQILNGQFDTGAQLPSQPELAEKYGASRVTVREALTRLEAEGLVVSVQGRGTFVRATRPPAVLVVDSEAHNRERLSAHAAAAGFRVIDVEGAEEALAALERDHNIVLVCTALRLPRPEHGVTLITAVRRRWPELALAVTTADAQDLQRLFGTAECPALIVSQPLHTVQVNAVLRLASQARPHATRRVTHGPRLRRRGR